MWGKARKRSGEDSTGDASDSDKGPPKKKKAAAAASEDDDIAVCDISKNRKVSVRYWQGNIMVDIREFYSKDGKDLPGRKGISLTLEQWNTLKDHIAKIDEAIAENS